MNVMQEVWIRPRKVFRELSTRPIGIADVLLSAAQGIVGILALSRMNNLGLKADVGSIFLKAVVQGSLSGIAIIWVQAWIYAWLGRRAGGVATQTQVVHVLAYGSTPLVGSLAIWCVATLLLGNNAFIEQPGGETDNFVALLMTLQIIAHVLLACWSAILQVMGLSEVQKLQVRGATGVWLIGQFVAALALLVLMIVLVGLGLIPLPQNPGGPASG
jgi:hypothetical protein